MIRLHYIDKILPFKDKPIIKVITGIRRCGKSTILEQFIDHIVTLGTDRNRVIYINLELMKFSHITDCTILYNEIKDALIDEKKHYILIDEIQLVPQWERAVNSLLTEKNYDIYITGSNSRMLSSELATLISGRYIEIETLPFVFSEFKKISSTKPFHQIDNNIFNEYMMFGGMPGIHHMEWKEKFIYQYLGSVFDSIILNDIIIRNKIRNPAFLELIIRFVFQNIGNIFSAKSIIDYLKKEKRSVGQETVYNYLSYLENAYVIFKVPRYDIKGKRVLEVNEKYYVGDIGLRHALLGFRKPDITGILENIIYLELRKQGYTITIGKQQEKEIDFIITKRDYKAYIQVATYLVNKETIHREFRVLKEIRDSYPKFILTMDKVPESNDEGIRRVYLPDFLLNQGYF